MIRYVVEFYVHIVIKRENVNHATQNDFAFDELTLAYIAGHMFDIGIHVWKQHQSKNTITYQHYDFIHRNAHQGAQNYYPVIHILWVEQGQRLANNVVFTCPQYRLLMHNGHVYDDVDRNNHSLTRSMVEVFTRPPIMTYKHWTVRRASIADLYNCIKEEFHGDSIKFGAFQMKCLKHFCALDNKEMSYFDSYEGCWKLIHAMAEKFPLIGLYGKFGIPEPDQTTSSGRFK
jgi:hypothetical protein